ncbi:MAG TPA: hypothetical protein VEQ63_09270 [Bryobacteraceae bacterium]|nr:hypothetical protein [Bryobacteraceae bacterium]
MASRNAALPLLLLCGVPVLRGQSDLKSIVERLERLEKQNQELVREIEVLRSQVAEARAEPNVSERLDVQERRIEEHADSKVEAANKLPVRLTGTVLMNIFSNGPQSGGAENPTTAALNPGLRNSGAMLRQSTLGLVYDGAPTVLGAKVSGSIMMDFFAGSNAALNHTFRVRTASVELDWENTSIVAGQLKPIISPRDPTSLAQVGVDPLTGAGNLWFWQPQVFVEQRIGLGEQTSIRARVGVYQTNESTAVNVPTQFAPTLARARPALQGRIELRRPNLELAPGFHVSRTQVAGTSVPSNAVTFDWMYRPLQKVELTGFVFAGANLSNMGTLRQGYTILGDRNVIALRARGGWAQLAIHPASRISLNIMAGQHDDNNADLRLAGIGKNEAYAANLMYRLAPNLVLALERSQVRTTYLQGGKRRNNHYDLAIGYSF